MKTAMKPTNEAICNKCNRVNLRAEEEIRVMVDPNTMTALEDSRREHICRPDSLTLLHNLMWRIT